VIEMRLVLAVGLGAALGGIFRLLIAQLVIARLGAGYAHYATVFINVSGSFLIGVVFELAQLRDFHPLWRPFLTTGILGGYTTFSTFSLEAVTLASRGMLGSAAAYVIGSAILGIGGAVLGIYSARLLVAP
jgi:CrcB protein